MNARRLMEPSSGLGPHITTPLRKNAAVHHSKNCALMSQMGSDSVIRRCLINVRLAPEASAVLHSIASSARNSDGSGIVRPSDTPRRITRRIGATHGAATMNRVCARSVCQRIGPHLDVYGARLGALAAFLQPRRAVAVRAPQAAALPAGVRVVDAPVQALGKKLSGYGMRSMIICPSLSAAKPSLRLAVEIGTFSPSPTVLCWSTQV